MTDDLKLLPCPFCKPDEDENPIVRKSSTDFDDSFRIECGNTDCRVHTIYFETVEEAITTWNTRENPQPVASEEMEAVWEHLLAEIQAHGVHHNLHEGTLDTLNNFIRQSTSHYAEDTPQIHDRITSDLYLPFDRITAPELMQWLKKNGLRIVKEKEKP